MRQLSVVSRKQERQRSLAQLRLSTTLLFADLIWLRQLHANWTPCSSICVVTVLVTDARTAATAHKHNATKPNTAMVTMKHPTMPSITHVTIT